MRALLLAVAVLAVGAAPVLAANPDQKTEPAKVIFKHGEDPADPGHCTANVFADWRAEKGWVAQSYTYTLNLADGSTREESGALDGPDYYDHYTFGGIVWDAPAGTHWWLISQTYVDGPGRTDCSDYDQKNHAQFDGKKVTLTFGITEECRPARDKLAAAKKAVKKAKGRKAKKAAKAKRKKAQAAYDKVCA
jgi:hypothetical protein